MVSAMLMSRGSVSSVSRPAVASFTSRSPVRARPQLRMRTVSMASPELTKEQKSAIETAIESAKETCESGSAGACATAWDEVEELSASAADKKQAKSTSDPLEQYCDDNPEADECRVYED
ncbi:TPA: CP12 domain [Trebouxia sp. C0004]